MSSFPKPTRQRRIQPIPHALPAESPPARCRGSLRTTTLLVLLVHCALPEDEGLTAQELQRTAELRSDCELEGTTFHCSTHPRFSLEGSAETGSLRLFQGLFEEALLEDLAQGGLNASHRRAELSLSERRAPEGAHYEPLFELEAGASYTLLHALPEAYLLEAQRYTLQVRAAAETLLGSWPPQGATGVTPELAALTLALPTADGSKPPALWHRGPASARQELSCGRAEATHCTGRGLPSDEQCVRCALPTPLAPGPHRIEEEDGSVLLGWSTAPPATDEAVIDGEAQCLPSQTLLAPGICHEALPEAARLRVAVMRPAYATLKAGGERSLAVAQSQRGWVELLSDAAPEGREVTLRVESVTGKEQRAQVILTASAERQSLRIHSAVANPVGSDTGAEELLITNHGTDTLQLEDYTISSSGAPEGSDILSPLWLAPGEQALLIVVTERFDTQSSSYGTDAQTLIARVRGSLSARGLSNSGESLQLIRRSDGQIVDSVQLPRSDDGQRWCFIPTLHAATEGRCEPDDVP